MGIKNHKSFLSCHKQIWVGTILGFALLIFISNCGSRIPVRAGVSDQDLRTQTDTEISSASKAPAKAKTSNRIEQQLRAEYEFWEGTKHKLGGMDRNGVDCSGFVMIVYQKLFNITLPRTTKTQSVIGRYVKRSELKVGDLVFFKPPFAARHVGIYLGNHEFIHASNSNGVTISEISPTYWSKYYWTGRRILPD